MRQRSDEFVDAMLQDDTISNDVSMSDKLAEIEHNINTRIETMQKELFEKLDVSRETFEPPVDTSDIQDDVQDDVANENNDESEEN